SCGRPVSWDVSFPRFSAWSAAWPPPPGISANPIPGDLGAIAPPLCRSRDKTAHKRAGSAGARVGRQSDAEGRPGARRAEIFDGAAVRLDDLARDRETEAGAVWL